MAFLLLYFGQECLKVNANGSILEFGAKNHQLSLCGFALYFDMLENATSIAAKHQNENLKPHDAWKIWYWSWGKMKRFDSASDSIWVLVPTSAVSLRKHLRRMKMASDPFLSTIKLQSCKHAPSWFLPCSTLNFPLERYWIARQKLIDYWCLFFYLLWICIYCFAFRGRFSCILASGNKWN